MNNRRTYVKITPELHDRIVALLKMGWTGADIAYETGVSQSRIVKIRKEVEQSGYGLWHNGGALSAYVY